MLCDYIILNELGCGPIAVKYSEIVTIELTALCASRISLSNGYIRVVEEDPPRILHLIEVAKKRCE